MKKQTTASSQPEKKANTPRSAAKRFLRFLCKWSLITLNTIIKVALLLPIPVFLLWYSFSIDRNGWFQGDQYEREVALAMLDGNAISNFEKMDERQITKLYAQNLSEPLDVISLGSSRVLQLTEDIVGTDSFFNAGMVGAEQPDVMSSYYLFDRAEKIPKTVIFCVDPWIFSTAPEATTYRRVDWTMYNEFLHYGLGQQDVDVTSSEENMALWLSLTSPAFFQENLHYYIENKETGMRPSVVTGDLYTQLTDIKMPDGSILYQMNLRNITSEDAYHLALTAINNSFVNCEGFYEMDASLVQLFSEFIQYMQSKGSTVVLMLTPYHPVVYEKVLEQPERYSGFFQVESWLRSYALQNNLALYGSYDPMAAGCTEEDFYDGWHVKGSGIAKFFPGISGVQPYSSLSETVTLHRLP